MSLFGSSKLPNSHDIEITFGNICATLNDNKYADGLDQTTAINMVTDIYNYVRCSKNIRIRLPAPVSDPEDAYSFMWPEGAKISSRAPSNSSTLHNGRNFDKYKTDRARNRASSVVSSSKFSARHIGFAEDDDEKHTYKHRKGTSHHKSGDNTERHRRPSAATSNTNESRVLRVNGQVMKPTPSMDQLFAGPKSPDLDEDNDNEEDEVQAPRPPVLRRQAKFSGFADEEE